MQHIKVMLQVRHSEMREKQIFALNEKIFLHQFRNGRAVRNNEIANLLRILDLNFPGIGFSQCFEGFPFLTPLVILIEVRIDDTELVIAGNHGCHESFLL